MTTALLIRIRPITPWRIGPLSGARESVDSVFHSDTLFSAVCHAFQQLGLLEEWLEATARPGAEPAVRFSSCFPMQRGSLFAPPPAGLWPPTAESGPRTRWHGAQFVPLHAIQRVLRGEGLRDEDYELDGHSGCLLPAAAHQPTGPFRLLRRSVAAVDRVTNASHDAQSVTCLQFAAGSGLWCVASFANQNAFAVWRPKVETAFRLLADAGFGGWRSRGFGRARQPEFQPGTLPDLVLPGASAGAASPSAARTWWLLSLYSPHPDDPVDWTAGDYRLITRGGRVQSLHGSGALKLNLRTVAEGSVLVSPAAPRGAVVDVAPPGAAHPVWRAGYAVSLPIALPSPARSAA